MKILVSACLLGIDCKYNGKNNKNDKIIELLKDHELIPVCPEIMGGLPTPRIPAEIHQNKVIAKDGKDVTKQYQKGAEEALKIANDTPFGLGASIYTENVEYAQKLARRVDSGMVYVNKQVSSSPELPFGGTKHSGYGRELSKAGILEFLNKKLVMIAK